MQSQRHCTTRRPCVCPFPVRGRMPIAPRVGAASDGDTIAATAIGQDFAVRDISCALRSTNEGKNCTTVSIVAAPRRIPIAGFRDKLPMTSSDDREPLSATSGRTPAVNGQPSISIAVARGARAQDERMKVQFGWPNFDCSLGPSMGQAYLSGALRSAGHDTNILHVSEWLDYAFDVDRIDVPIVLGGIHTTLNARQVMTDNPYRRFWRRGRR